MPSVESGLQAGLMERTLPRSQMPSQTLLSDSWAMAGDSSPKSQVLKSGVPAPRPTVVPAPSPRRLGTSAPGEAGFGSNVRLEVAASAEPPKHGIGRHQP